jgi:hypothetical protein
VTVGTTADFNLSREELVDLSLGLVGKANPGTDDRALAYKVLNSFVRHLDVRGDWFWAVDKTESSLTLVSSQSEYTTGALSTNIATNILRLQWVGKIETNNDRIPISILSGPLAESTLLKGDTASEPVAVYLDRAAVLANNVLIVYPTPNSAYTLKYTYRRPLYDFDLSTDNPDMPSEMLLPLQYGLAYHLSPHFGTSLNERTLLKGEFEEGLRHFQLQKPNKETNFRAKSEYF